MEHGPDTICQTTEILPCIRFRERVVFMIIFGVSLTVLVVLVVGIGVARKIDGDSVNYLVAGRRLGVPLVAVSLTAAAVDSNATVGNTDLTAAFGF